MSITVIEKTIYLEPKYLDQNIMKHLLDKVKKITFEECTKEYGHILCVKRILKINNLEDTIFTVRFEAETLKPIVGNKLTGTVCMLYKDGIFLQISKKQKMLIPATTIENYSFNTELNLYSCDTNTIKNGDKIEAIITAVQYCKKNFSCIGCLSFKD